MRVANCVCGNWLVSVMAPLHLPINPPHCTHSAEFAADDEDPALIQHAGIQVEHIVHIHSHEVLCQISLGERTEACGLTGWFLA